MCNILNMCSVFCYKKILDFFLCLCYFIKIINFVFVFRFSFSFVLFFILSKLKSFKWIPQPIQLYCIPTVIVCNYFSISVSPPSLSLFNLGPNHYRVVPLDVIKPRAPQYTFRIKLKVFLIDTPGKIYVLLFFFPKNFKHFVCAIKYVYVYTYYKLKKKKQIIHNFKCLNSYVCVCVMYIVIA